MMTYRRELLIPKLISDSGNIDFISSASGVYSGLSYFAFNNTNLNSSDCLIFSTSGDRYIKIAMSKSVSINGLLFTSRNADTLAEVFPSDYDVYISNDDSIYTRIVSFGSPTTINTNKEILFPRRKCKYIKIIPKMGMAAIGELNFYMSNEFYLIKQDGKYFSFNPAQYDVTTKQFKETDVATIKANINIDLNSVLSEKYYFTSDMIIGGETFKPIDKFGDHLQIVCVKNAPCAVYGIKSKKEMIVSNVDVSVKYIERINEIKSIISKDEDCKINFVISNDEGKTWKTTIDDGATYINLISDTVLDTPNNEDWNLVMNKILVNGMSIDSIYDIDFNSLITTNKIRFAFAISISGFDSNAILSELQWNINSIGFLRQLSSNDVGIDLYTDKIKIIPKTNFNELKINVGTGGKITINQINNEINTSSNEEIINVISEVWTE